MRVSRRLLLGGLLGSVASQAFANAPLRSLRPVPRDAALARGAVRPATDLVAEARLSGKVAFAVADAETGEIIETRNPVLAMPPASVTKAVTALYALDRLGPDFRFRTKLIGTGPLVNGKLRGDLVLAGGGDPTLDSDALGDLAGRLKEAGLREIEGRFLISASSLPAIFSIDPEQPDHMGYNPAVSGLNLNYNRVHFEWKRAGGGGYDVSMDARARRYSPAVGISRMQIVDRRVPVYTYADTGGTDDWTVARRALGSGGSRWLPVRKPELYAAEVFQTLARSHGIVLPRAEVIGETPAGEVLAEQTSAPLRDMLRSMLKWSTNLIAEVAGLTATHADGKGVRTLAESAAEMSRWAKEKLGARKAAFVDHSGLGDQSRMAATDMVRALVRVREAGVLAPILKPFPMRNKNYEVVQNHPVKVRAKTGTLNFVSTLAGYVTRPDGRDLAFAIFTSDLSLREAIAPDDRDVPDGSRAWGRRSRHLQMRLLERWGKLPVA